MICSVLGVTPAQIGALRAKPSLLRNLALVLQGNRLRALLDDVIEHAPAERRAELEARQDRFEQSPAGREMAARDAEARLEVAALGPIESVLGLENSWAMLRFLLTGDVGGSPGDLLLSGENVGEDLGYGPARLHDEARTRELSRFLEEQDLARLQARVDLQEMNRLGVYALPGGPDAEHEKGLRDEVALYFPRLQDYAREMSDKGNGLLVWVS